MVQEKQEPNIIDVLSRDTLLQRASNYEAGTCKHVKHVHGGYRLPRFCARDGYVARYVADYFFMLYNYEKLLCFTMAHADRRYKILMHAVAFCDVLII